MDKLTPWQNCLVKCHNGIPLFNVTLTQRKALFLSRHHLSRSKALYLTGILLILWQMSLGQMSHKQIVTWTKYYPLDAMIRCPLSCQFFHLDKCHQDKCHLDKCPLDKSYLANHAAQPSLIIRNTYFLLFLLLGPSVAMQSTWSPYLCMKMNICACGVTHALWLPDRGSVRQTVAPLLWGTPCLPALVAVVIRRPGLLQSLQSTPWAQRICWRSGKSIIDSNHCNHCNVS